MHKALLFIVLSLFCLGSVAQEAKLNTRPKTYKPKVKVLYDTQTANLSHHRPALWKFNGNTEIEAYRPIINMSNVDEIFVDDKNKVVRVKYKVEKPEIISLHELARKYGKVSGKDILFSVDDEWQKQPDSTFIAIDVIKHVRVVDSKNYPYLSEKKNQLVVVAIKTVNPPKKEEDDGDKPKIYIR
jgi:hypothetical protein